MSLTILIILLCLIFFFTLFGYLMKKPDWVVVAGILFILIGFNLALTGLNIPLMVVG